MRKTFHKPIRATKTWETIRQFMVGMGVYWDSNAERQYFHNVLCNLLSKPEIIIKPIPLEIEGGTYRPDFQVIFSDNSEYYVEVKGSESPMWRRTRKQLRERYPSLRLLIVFGRADKKRGFVTTKQEWLNEIT